MGSRCTLPNDIDMNSELPRENKREIRQPLLDADFALMPEARYL